MFSPQVAITNQYACKTIMQADEQFERSCEMCCNSPQCLYRRCEECKVAQVHKCVIEQLKNSIEG